MPQREPKPNELSAVLADLEAIKGDKVKLMQQYSDEQKKILDLYGGSLGDVPCEVDHPYHKLQDKIYVLGRL